MFLNIMLITLFIVNFNCEIIFSQNQINEHQDNQIKISNQQLDNKTEILDLFFQQPKYNKASIQFFLTDIYNHRYYAQKFLALNFSHVKTFLSYSNESPQARTYIKTVLKLFSQKLKSTNYINSYAFCLFLNDLPNLLKKHFTIESNESVVKKEIKDSLYNFLLNDFNDLKKDPEKSLNNITQKLYNIACEKKSDDISALELQINISQFLEICLSKLVWNPEDQKEVWESIKNIANNLETLNSENIIDLETLDSLYWTLISRFCYFLEICGNELKEECFEKINEDLATQKSPLWSLSEREEFITTKSYHLKRAIIESEIRARAYHSGLITDLIPPVV